VDRSKKIIERRVAVKCRNCDMRIQIAESRGSGKFLFGKLSPPDRGMVQDERTSGLTASAAEPTLSPHETDASPI